MERIDVLPHHILIPQDLPTIRTRIRAHHPIVREHVLPPRVPMREGLRADLTHVILRRAEVEALLVTLERLHRR